MSYNKNNNNGKRHHLVTKEESTKVPGASTARFNFDFSIQKEKQKYMTHFSLSFFHSFAMILQKIKSE